MAYWLFKTEPDVFSIDTLKHAPAQTAFWEGIRNYQARNFLRDNVRIGDQVFIYHSSCKVPAITGIAKVVKEADVDPFQFNPESVYFDPKSDPDKPRWVGVTIQYVQHLPKQLTLQAIKADPAIEDLALKKAGRLSIMPVTEKEWDYLLGQAGVKG